jgi:NarL family two-component system response regulator LiaR
MAGAMKSIRIALVDDHRVVCRALRSYLSAFPDLLIVGEANSAEQLLAEMGAWQPDVVLMDLTLPGGMDGISAIRLTLEASPRTRVVALTAATDEARVIAALRAGAISYVRKDAEPELLLAAVRAASQGKPMFDPSAAGVILRDFLAESDPAGELTTREMDVLRELAHGRTNREIAAALCISEETAKSHVASIFGKLQISNRGQAIVYALKRGMVSLEEL